MINCIFPFLINEKIYIFVVNLISSIDLNQSFSQIIIFYLDIIPNQYLCQVNIHSIQYIECDLRLNNATH